MSGSSIAKIHIETIFLNQGLFENLNLLHLIAMKIEFQNCNFSLFGEFFKLSKDIVKIPIKFISTQWYSDTGYRFGSNITAFYIKIEE